MHYRIVEQVRVERDEVKYPPKGSWPRYRGKRGTVVRINQEDAEIGVVLGKTVDERPDQKGMSYGSRPVVWFLPHELRRVGEAAEKARRASAAAG